MTGGRSRVIARNKFMTLSMTHLGQRKDEMLKIEDRESDDSCHPQTLSLLARFRVMRRKDAQRGGYKKSDEPSRDAFA